MKKNETQVGTIRETDGRHRQRGQNTESKTPNNRKTSQREEGKKKNIETREWISKQEPKLQHKKINKKKIPGRDNERKLLRSVYNTV